MSTNRQYIVPTNGAPIRGLIQDHVIAGLLLSQKDTFLTKEEYCQLVYNAVWESKDNSDRQNRIQLIKPSILKPKPLWTGKDCISTILLHLTREQSALYLESKSKVPSTVWSKNALEECDVIIRQGKLLTGILDKSQFGASKYGLVHAFYELYGADMAGSLLTVLGRMFILFLQLYGHTCSIEDLVLQPSSETFRKTHIEQSIAKGHEAVIKYLQQDPNAQDPNSFVDKLDPHFAKEENNVQPQDVYKPVRMSLMQFLGKDEDGRRAEALDGAVKSALNPVTSELISNCLPRGQHRLFPRNGFSNMVFTGAKGSLVNHAQISCLLGQQELEGRRVPIMASGRSLPSFMPFDSSPRAGGYITQRFLTGLKAQEYYFHCMAGREGLVDTAVKTSRSGYLQRCLIKHMEDLVVAYDHTVCQIHIY